MKYNELRLDNWVRWNGPSHKEDARITWMTKEEVGFACGDTAQYNELRPIKLSKKLLEKIGFDYIGKDFDGIDTYELKDFRIDVCGKEYSDFHSGTPIKSLHQLQNLYYQLEGVDLKINIK
jgi:hypothetical protein